MVKDETCIADDIEVENISDDEAHHHHNHQQ
jgi:hypothetical protein